ncbi:hypothetical protein SAMN05216553_107284 [Lentzea fradiae]|uniref:Extracellular repeat, HAF family n=1 Tax=Lentzea fradiae TaxID=200378 RepID=A0A1G7TKR3_9PSEU|nr:hypothetical protein [Lentzea fradiae]SDG35100.1 hypothetical protein SAMN05216553_107284 [Lentzea fradiae]
MKKTLSLLPVALVAAVLITPPAHAVTVEDLGTLPGDLRSAALDVNDSGTIAGVSYGSGTTQHAVRWDRFDGIKKLADLGFDTWAGAINRDSVVVGYAVTAANRTQAVKWLPSGALVQLTVQGSTGSVAYDVNDSGFVTGTAVIDGVSQAVLWDSIGDATVLGPGSGSRVTGANWVVGTDGGDVVRWNASGVRTVLGSGVLLGSNQLADAVGTVGTGGVRWSRDGSRTDLGTNARPFDLSDNGWTVGEVSSQAYRWDSFSGTGAPLAPAPSSAAEVNNSGVVAGTVGTSAATWDMTGTQKLLPALSGATRHRVTGLSEAGQVIGVANLPDGTYRAIVWR